MAADPRLETSADAFGRAIEAHRRDVVLLCYRFLGSIHEAEEAAQETAANRRCFCSRSTPRVGRRLSAFRC